MNDPHENATWVYSYDRGGNILSKAKYAYTTGTLGTAAETIPYTYGDANWKDKLTAYNGTAITYDAIGNPLNDGMWTYEWQAGRQLKRMSRDGQALTFKYDHNGMRIQKVLEHDWYPETTNYTYHGKLLTHMEVEYYDFDEVKHTDKLHFFYDAQSRPVKISYNGVIYTYVHNLQGDIVGILDSTGALVVEYKYDAWGKLLSTTGSLADTLGKRNPFRYRGYIYDEESELYYLRSRYYNPVIGRFVNADVLVGKLNELFAHNSFAYCMNAPAQCKDSDGQWPSWATKLIVGAAAVLVGAAVVALTAGTASVFVPALVTGLQSAAVAGAASAATSVATEVVCTVAEGGTIKDVAENALVAARDGFADGFMVGGISAGVTMMATAPLMHSNGIGVGKTAKPNKPRVDIGYGNPKAHGYTAVNVNNNAGKSVFRIDYDPTNGLHAHYGATNALRQIHRRGAAKVVMGIIGGTTGVRRVLMEK